MRYVLIFWTLLLSATGLAQHKGAYKIFSSEGKEISFEKMLKLMHKSDLIFFGEIHNDPISHWLELQVVKSLYESNPNLVLAMEMFEADDQVVIDEYLSDLIEERQLLAEAKVWDNYTTDYKPLVDFAREKKLPLIASNIPRRYANIVYRKGIGVLDSLSETSKKFMVPLPIEIDLELKGYKAMITKMGGHGSGNAEDLARSQALKDANMEYFILQRARPVSTILDINGAYHSQDG